jgi:hypothetical protein
MKRTLLTLLVGGLSAPAYAGGLAIVRTELRDNGDHDGYADTNETVELWLTVKNTTGLNLTGVVAQLSIASGRTVCILDGTATIGNVAAGATVVAPEPLVFHVASDQDRTALGLNAFAPLTAPFNIAFQASPVSPTAYPSELVFDLDLDITGGGAPGAVVESFESGGFGLFTVQNLDFGLHHDVPSEINNTAPRRCQYSYPLCVGASCQGNALQCSLGGTTAAADAVWWRIDGPATPGGGRGSSGTHSLYFGQPLGPGYTTPAGVMEAVATTAPIHFAMGFELAHALSFKHQVSFVDNRSISNMAFDGGQTLDRGVVMLQLADAEGTAIGDWIRLEPSINVHDTWGASHFGNCTFDPIDDGNDENDLDPPFLEVGDRNRRGPSSTCADEGIFACLGATQGAFDPTAVCRADGPGLQGSWGPGTWVETRYDLSRYRGRYVRLRFLASTMRYGTSETWQAAGFFISTDPRDDGWWIDDLTISGTTSVAGGVVNDTNDNSGLVPDGDADGVDNLCDNCPAVTDPTQIDFDGDRVGDPCDTCTDGDGDGAGNPGFPPNTCAIDNCPLASNPTQADPDGDGLGSACDNCPVNADPSQANADGDPAGDLCDCAPTSSATYPGAPERNDGLDNNCPGDADYGIIDEVSGRFGFFGYLVSTLKLEISWPSQAGATSYTLASLTGATYASATTCTSMQTGNLTHVLAIPPPGQTTFYLVRAQTPRVGSWGRGSSGVPRTVSCAP